MMDRFAKSILKVATLLAAERSSEPTLSSN
jgi:hypothetical protein